MAKRVTINSDGIESKLQNYEIDGVLIEYIANSFDAGAINVNVTYDSHGMAEEETLQHIDLLSIKDDGQGISFYQIDKKFQEVFVSEKARTLSTVSNNFYFGSKGSGRFSFRCIADKAEWVTVYKGKKSNKKYSINISANSLEEYDIGNPVDVAETTGTTVTLTNITKHIPITDIKKSIVASIRRYFSWYLELKSRFNTAIVINGYKIDASPYIKFENTHNIIIDNISFDIKFVIWNDNLKDQSSKIYYSDLKGNWTSETTKLNNKADKFHHSVFVYSDFYNEDFIINENGILDTEQNKSKISHLLDEEIKSTLRSIRRTINEENINRMIDGFESDNLLPKYNPSSPIELFQHSLLVEAIKKIYEVMPDFYNSFKPTQKKIFFRLMNRIIEQDDIENLFDIINHVLELAPTETKDLVAMLNKHKLNQIINTINLLDNRLEIISEFEKLILSSAGKDLYEARVQEFMENNYWLIGEDFELCGVEDDDFRKSIGNFVDKFYENEDKEYYRKIAKSHNHQDIKREMDILMGRKDIKQGCFNGTILELKRPKIKIGKDQYRQLEDYKDALLSFPQFNDPSHQWSFYVIGVNIDSDFFDDVFNRSSKSNKNIGLLEESKNYKLYVKTWSQLFNEFKIKHSYLSNKLNEKAKILTSHIN